jgi:hypothetical protein
VFASFPQPAHLPCPACGESLSQSALDDHVCEHERWLGYQVFQLRHEIEEFDLELARYLESPRGQFELWYAERERRLAA